MCFSPTSYSRFLSKMSCRLSAVAYSYILVIASALTGQASTMGVRDRPLLPRVLEGDGLHEHVREHDPHRRPDLGERQGIPHLAQQAFFFGLRAHAVVLSD